MSTLELFGIIIGCIAGFAILVFVIACFAGYLKSKKKK